MDIKDWINNWFENNSDLNLEEIIKFQDEDYFAKGWIDSFKFIRMVTEIEEKFKINFSNDEFQDKKFSTINGLSEIIEARIEKKL